MISYRTSALLGLAAALLSTVQAVIVFCESSPQAVVGWLVVVLAVAAGVVALLVQKRTRRAGR